MGERFLKILLLIFSPFKISLMITAISVISLFNHHRGTSTIDWVERLENAFSDIRFRMRGEIPPSGKVGVLAIDEKSIQKFGRWPFSRDIYAQAFKNLKTRGVQWIGYDVMFSEPQRPTLDESLGGIQSALEAALAKGGFDMDAFNEGFAPLVESSPSDASLAQGMKEFENIVQAFFFFEKGQEAGQNLDWAGELEKVKAGVIDLAGKAEVSSSRSGYFSDQLAHGLLGNTPLIAASTQYQAFMNNEGQSDDGIVRAVTMVKPIQLLDDKGKIVGEPSFFPSLSLSLAANALGRVIVVQYDDVGIQDVKLMDPDAKLPEIQIPLTNNSRGWMLLNHYGPPGTMPHVSLADAYDNKFEGEEYAFLKKTGFPQVLVMGGTGTGINDFRPSPFSKSFNGVEHHAASADNILTQNFFRRSEAFTYYEYLALILAGVLLGLLLRKASALTSLLVMATFILAFAFIDRHFLFGRGYWFYSGLLYAQSMGIYVLVILFKYFIEEREKRQVKGAFQHYLNPSVINELLAHPERLKLGGEKKVLTVFFSDVRGFTTLSETLSPEDLTSLLNEYFTPMTQIVLDSGGLLDKYIGDAMMAVWGAPMDLPDQADRALRSGLLMLEELGRLRAMWAKRGTPLIDIGMGINTGPMTVGNMGSHQRFDYTVLGDAVNLASRLEGISKQYHVRSVVSQMTKDALLRPQDFFLRELDLIVVKGKTEPVRIYENLVVKPGQEGKARELVEAFSHALDIYRKQRWDEARAQFESILRLAPNDGPSTVFIERCEYFKEHPPAPDWIGDWVMKTK